MISYLMSLVFLILICSGVLAADYLVPPIAHNDCPKIDDINHPIMLPYLQDCNKYYSCLNGNAYLQQCPNNLHWSTITYRCDYPNVAKCQTTEAALPVTANTVNAANTNTLTATLTGEIIYQLHATDCTKYYKCQVLACPRNYYWNSLTQKCDFPHNAHCPFIADVGSATGIISSSPLQSEGLDIKTNQNEEFTRHYPNDCAKFYQCQSMLCPASYHWNVHTQQCDLPQLAECPMQPQMSIVVETSSIAAVPTAFTAPPTPAVTTQSIGNATAECLDCVQSCDGNSLHHYLPHPSDCHKFIQCNGWSFVHTCPDNLFWNAKLNTCDRICVIN